MQDYICKKCLTIANLEIENTLEVIIEGMGVRRKGYLWWKSVQFLSRVITTDFGEGGTIASILRGTGHYKAVREV